jgi:hypothetical protein
MYLAKVFTLPGGPIAPRREYTGDRDSCVQIQINPAKPIPAIARTAGAAPIRSANRRTRATTASR